MLIRKLVTSSNLKHKYVKLNSHHKEHVDADHKVKKRFLVLIEKLVTYRKLLEKVCWFWSQTYYKPDGNIRRVLILITKYVTQPEVTLRSILIMVTQKFYKPDVNLRSMLILITKLVTNQKLLKIFKVEFMFNFPLLLFNI